MDTLQNMRAFVRVLEAGSFTAAANSMNVTVGAVSRAVSELESHLRTRLLDRSTRRHALTEAGERYLQRCRAILADVSFAEDEAARAHECPTGALRLHSFAGIADRYLLPAISQYRRLYPDVKMELTLSQRLPDLFEGSSDVSFVCARTLKNSELIAQRLGTTFSILCASPGYAQSEGLPGTPDHLHRHQCLDLKTFDAPVSEWQLDGPAGHTSVPISASVQVNTPGSMEAAIRAGMGIGPLPLYTAIEGLCRGQLVRVLPQHRLQPCQVYALYPSVRFVDAKIRTWVGFLKTFLPVAIERDRSALDAPGSASQETVVLRSGSDERTRLAASGMATRTAHATQPRVERRVQQVA